MLPASFVRTDSMESPELQRLRAAIVRDPGNAELRYLLGAELAQRREYPEAVAQMRTARRARRKRGVEGFQARTRSAHSRRFLHVHWVPATGHRAEQAKRAAQP